MERNDHIEWPTERLNERLTELRVNKERVKYTGERLHQVEHEMSMIALELSCRYRDNRSVFLPDNIAEIAERI